MDSKTNKTSPSSSTKCSSSMQDDVIVDLPQNYDPLAELVTKDTLVTLSNGDKYSGQFRGNYPDGQGKIITVNADIYDGQFKAGKYHGQGTILFKSGNKYTGQWMMGKRHGEGK
mmetsp:Transcript_36575/g.26649  ORF Transcript_36575/g.26649 Transcript_36575/m.26649 type:complete len:114 (-) Transcript_36575:797-1138(-)